MISYKFKLYPNREQRDKLDLSLDICRMTYNNLLAELDKGFNKNELANFLLDLKVCYPEMNRVYSKTIQVENDNLFRNLKSLGNSKKNGNRVGRLRFKGKGWKKTFTFNQSGFKLINNKKLHLSKIGDINIKVHRDVVGNIKQIIIKKEIDKWFAIIQTDGIITRQKGGNEVGIDFGLINFMTDNNGNKISLPSTWSKQEKKIKKHHKNLSRTKKGSHNRRKQIKLLQRSYEVLNNQKNDFFHKLSTKLVTQNKIIYLEDLDIKEMMMKSYNAKNFQKSAWSKFVNMFLNNKAESADCSLVFCDRFAPTSQECSSCGRIQKLKLSNRTYNCPCGLILDRDINAGKNIIKYGKLKYQQLGTSCDGNETSTQSNEQVSLMKSEANQFIGW